MRGKLPCFARFYVTWKWHYNEKSKRNCENFLYEMRKAIQCNENRLKKNSMTHCDLNSNLVWRGWCLEPLKYFT